MPRNKTAVTDGRYGSYRVHPFRERIPEMPPEQYAALLASVRETGQAPVQPALVDEQGWILDGRARIRACIEAGVAFTPIVPREAKPATVILHSLNTTSYSVATRTLIAARMMDELAVEARVRQHAGVKVGENSAKGRAADQAARAVGLGTARGCGKNVAAVAAMVAAKDQALDLVDAGLIYRVEHVLQLRDMDETTRKTAFRRLRNGDSPDVVLGDRNRRNDVWLTPPSIVERIRYALDGIACDPCGPIGGFSWVKAETTYTEDDDGLDEETCPWPDRTFVNPPFSDTLPWIARAINESARRKRIYMLLPVRPDTVHQQAALASCLDVLYVTGRVSFDKPDGSIVGSGLNGVMILGFGCTTSKLLAIGIEGVVMKGGASEDREIVITAEDDEVSIVFGDLIEPPVNNRTADDFDFYELSEEELAESARDLARQPFENAEWVARGRAIGEKADADHAAWRVENARAKREAHKAERERGF